MLSKIFLCLSLLYVAGVFIFTSPRFLNEKNLDLSKEVVSFIGVVAKEPDTREKSQKLTIEIVENNFLLGKVLVTTRRYPEYKYGDKLKITGKLQIPSKDIEGFNYKDYLIKDGIYYLMSFPKMEILGQGFGNPLMSFLLSFKNKFQKTARSFIPRPQVGFLEALVFGAESDISQTWKNKLNLTGTRHIAAVSGMNITLVSVLILNFLLAIGFWRRQAFYLTIVLIILYILMIGAPASAVRAGIMAGLFLTAQQAGRASVASRAVVFACVIMLSANPLLLRLDIGFQLSFLATMGLIYLQPFFSKLLKKIPESFQLRSSLSATLSAQFFTLPVLIYNFGYISLISPLANILIVPVLAPLTILIFIFGFLAMILPAFGWILSFPVFFALNYILEIIDLFSRVPFALLKIENLHWAGLVVFYLILLIIILRLQKIQRELNFLKY